MKNLNHRLKMRREKLLSGASVLKTTVRLKQMRIRRLRNLEKQPKNWHLTLLMRNQTQM